MAAVTICSDLGAQENKLSHSFHCFPIYLPWRDWIPWSSFFECLVFSQLFSLSVFTIIKSLFSSSSLYAIRVVSSAYLRLLVCLLAILIPTCASSNLAFCVMYSAYKLNKQGENILPWHASLSILNQSIVPCPVLTIGSWPTYRLLGRQVKCSDIPISSRIFHWLLWSTHSRKMHKNICYVTEET